MSKKKGVVVTAHADERIMRVIIFVLLLVTASLSLFFVLSDDSLVDPSVGPAVISDDGSLVDPNIEGNSSPSSLFDDSLVVELFVPLVS
jgi:hypothetical protein